MYLEKDDGDLTSFASRLSCLICSTFASSYSSGSDSNRGVNLIFALIGDGIGGARVTMESSILTNESTFSLYGRSFFNRFGPNPNDILTRTNGKMIRLIKIEMGLMTR